MKIKDLTQCIAEGIPAGNESDQRRKLIKYIAREKKWDINDLEHIDTQALIQLYKECQKDRKDWLNRRSDWWGRANALSNEKGISFSDALEQTPHDLDQKSSQGQLKFKEQGVAEGFDSAAFDRHMDKLRAQKELEKTDPLRALVNQMHSDDAHAEKLKRKHKPDDERQITDPFHSSQSVNIGQQGVAENMLEETYDGDEFFEAYGELWFNEDNQLDEADYHGRSVPLGKPMQGDVKKFKVYVKDPSTSNIKKVNFGDPDMKIRKSNPAARRSFRARHNCDNPGPRTMARYWSCRKW